MRKPVFNNMRKAEYFNVGDEIMLFYDDKWNEAKVVRGYRHHEGCVNYISKNYPTTYLDGPGGAGIHTPQIILKSSFEYFLKNKEYFLEWCKEAGSMSYNGTDLRDMLISMRLKLHTHRPLDKC